MVVVGTGGLKTKIINKKYPAVSGITAGTTKTHGRKPFLKPTNKSLVPEKDKVGIS